MIHDHDPLVTAADLIRDHLEQSHDFEGAGDFAPMTLAELAASHTARHPGERIPPARTTPPPA